MIVSIVRRIVANHATNNATIMAVIEDVTHVMITIAIGIVTPRIHAGNQRLATMDATPVTNLAAISLAIRNATTNAENATMTVTTIAVRKKRKIRSAGRKIRSVMTNVIKNAMMINAVMTTIMKFTTSTT